MDGDTVGVAHLICSSLSAACCMVVLLLSSQIEPLRRFPNNMLMWKTACDLVTSCCLVGMNAAMYGNGDDQKAGHDLCKTGGAGQFSLLAFLISASAIASPGWFGCLAFNLNRSLHDPFTRRAETTKICTRLQPRTRTLTPYPMWSLRPLLCARTSILHRHCTVAGLRCAWAGFMHGCGARRLRWG